MTDWKIRASPRIILNQAFRRCINKGIPKEVISSIMKIMNIKSETITVGEIKKILNPNNKQFDGNKIIRIEHIIKTIESSFVMNCGGIDEKCNLMCFRHLDVTKCPNRTKRNHLNKKPNEFDTKNRRYKLKSNNNYNNNSRKGMNTLNINNIIDVDDDSNDTKNNNQKNTATAVLSDNNNNDKIAIHDNKYDGNFNHPINHQHPQQHHQQKQQKQLPYKPILNGNNNNNNNNNTHSPLFALNMNTNTNTNNINNNNNDYKYDPPSNDAVKGNGINQMNINDMNLTDIIPQTPPTTTCTNREWNVTLNQMVQYEQIYKKLKKENNDEIAPEILMNYLIECGHDDKMKICNVMNIVDSANDKWPTDEYTKFEFISIMYLMDKSKNYLPSSLPQELTTESLINTAFKQSPKLHDLVND